MIKVTNPILNFGEGEKNPNHIIAGTAKNGAAEKRLIFRPGKTANVEGTKELPGVVPVWIWNQFRDSDVGSRYVREGRLLVEGDPAADKMVAEYKAEQAAAKKAEDAEKRAAKKAAAAATEPTVENKDTAEQTPK